jgi:hypothetical protein
MPVSTIRNKEKSPANTLMYILGIIGVGLVVFFGGELLRNLDSVRGKSGLTVDVVQGKAEVYVNDAFLGETPLQSNNIKPGERKITIKNDSTQYQTTINFLPAKKDILHVVGIIRDLGISDTFSSGQEFWFEKDTGVSLKIISFPAGAEIKLDGISVGKTPYASSTISPGSYEIEISFNNYETQKARVTVEKGYTLNGSIQLFPTPVPSSLDPFEDSPNIYDLSLEDAVITTDTQKWALAVVYWNETRGIDISGTGKNRELVFNYFIDYKGNIFDERGKMLSSTDELATLSSAERGAYLGRTQDGEGITNDARDALNTLFDLGLSSKTATIKETGMGWLRVRSLPSLSGEEVTRVDVGLTFSVLEEQTGWVKIKVSADSEGWVSSDYVTLSE